MGAREACQQVASMVELDRGEPLDIQLFEELSVFRKVNRRYIQFWIGACRLDDLAVPILSEALAGFAKGCLEPHDG